MRIYAVVANPIANRYPVLVAADEAEQAIAVVQGSSNAVAACLGDCVKGLLVHPDIGTVSSIADMVARGLILNPAALT